MENASLIIMAGSDTTATHLSGLTALLIRNPTCLDRLREEVRSAFRSDQDITFTSVKKLKYLQACVNEGLRCYPPSAGGLPRVTPREGGIIDGQFVPGGVSKSQKTSSVRRQTVNASLDTSLRLAICHKSQ